MEGKIIYIYPADVENLVKQLLEAWEKCAYTVKTAQTFHNKIKEWKDGMPWATQPNDLQLENFKMPKMLRQFLTTFITEKDCNR